MNTMYAGLRKRFCVVEAILTPQGEEALFRPSEVGHRKAQYGYVVYCGATEAYGRKKRVY